jgi:hypothetical protein
MEVAFEGLPSSTLVGSQTALAQRHIRKMPQSLWEEGWFPSPLIGTHGDDLRGVLKPSMVGYVPSPLLQVDRTAFHTSAFIPGLYSTPLESR